MISDMPLKKPKIRNGINLKIWEIMQRRTSWYVITDGSSAGKTTTVNLLKAGGYKTIIEHARHYIDSESIDGRTVEEIRNLKYANCTGK